MRRLYIVLYLYVFTSPITMPVGWLALVRDTGWLPASPQLKPLYLRLFFTTAHRKAFLWGCRASVVCIAERSQSFHTTSPQPTLPEDQTSPHASLNSQTLVGLSEPSGSGWLQLLSGACAAHLKPSIHPPPATQLKTRARCGDHSMHVMGFLLNHSPQGTVGHSAKSD